MKNKILIRILMGLAGGLAFLTRTAIGIAAAAILIVVAVFAFKNKKGNGKEK